MIEELNMEKKSEVFLGQKKSIARYDLEKQKPTEYFG